jgi:hypothetical protein
VNVNEGLVAGVWWRVTRNEQLATSNGMGYRKDAEDAEGWPRRSGALQSVGVSSLDFL